MTSTLIPRSIVRRWLDPLGIATIHSVPAGMSGARVFCCVSQQRAQYALKRWPRGVDQHRIDEVHQVMRASRNSGCKLVPTVVESPIQTDGYCWDMLQWVPGEPLATDASLRNIQSGAAAIARFHSATLDLGVHFQVAPAVTERLSRLTKIDQQISAALDAVPSSEMTPPLSTAVFRAAQLLRLNWNEVRPRISRSLSVHAERKVATRFVLRDVHREHILFIDGRPTGLIDFDAIRIDSPAADLARWAGSSWIDGDRGVLRDNATVWEAVLAGVRTENPSKENYVDDTDVQLARAIARANPWISLANWLIWLTLEQRRFPAGPLAVAQRISVLTDAASQVI